MAVGDENIRPTIVVKIHKAGPPSHVREARLRDLCRPACVVETLVTEVVV